MAMRFSDLGILVLVAVGGIKLDEKDILDFTCESYRTTCTEQCRLSCRITDQNHITNLVDLRRCLMPLSEDRNLRDCMFLVDTKTLLPVDWCLKSDNVTVVRLDSRDQSNSASIRISEVVSANLRLQGCAANWLYVLDTDYIQSDQTAETLRVSDLWLTGRKCRSELLLEPQTISEQVILKPSKDEIVDLSYWMNQKMGRIGSQRMHIQIVGCDANNLILGNLSMIHRPVVELLAIQSSGGKRAFLVGGLFIGYSILQI